MNTVLLHDGTKIKYSKIKIFPECEEMITINTAEAGTPILSIPSRIENLPVAEILPNAIHNDPLLQKIILPVTLRRIVSCAINDNPSLKTVVIKSSNCELNENSIDTIDQNIKIQCKYGSTTQQHLLRYDNYSPRIEPIPGSQLKQLVYGQKTEI